MNDSGELSRDPGSAGGASDAQLELALRRRLTELVRERESSSPQADLELRIAEVRRELDILMGAGSREGTAPPPLPAPGAFVTRTLPDPSAAVPAVAAGEPAEPPQDGDPTPHGAPAGAAPMDAADAGAGEAEAEPAAPGPDAGEVDPPPASAAPGAAGDATRLEVGGTFANRYEVLARIGQGGMGTVYAAYDRTRRERVAIKVLEPRLTLVPQIRERFLREAKATGRLQHVNVINVFDVQEHEGVVFISMELLEGETLLRRIRTRKAPFAPGEVAALSQQLTRGLTHAHRVLVHRDLKPDNIFLCADGTVKVMDFGIAHLREGTRITEPGQILGNPKYMAPEQFDERAQIDHRADQFSVAMMCYLMLAGELPKLGHPPSVQALSGAPPHMAQAIVKALSNRPSDRFADMAAFHRALTDDDPGFATAPPRQPARKEVRAARERAREEPAPPPRRERSRSLLKPALAGVALVLLAGMGGVAYLAYEVLRDPTDAEVAAKDRSTLGEALRSGDDAALAALLEEDPVLGGSDESGRTVFHHAVERNRSEALALLGRQARATGQETALEQADAHGLTPLLLAARLGRLDAARVLLELGASPLAVDGRKDTGLHQMARRAAAPGDAELVELLAGPGAGEGLFYAANADGKTAVELAAELEREPLRQLLRDTKARQLAARDAADADGRTALIRAIEARDGARVRTLLAWEADPDAGGGPSAKRPLHLAVELDEPEVVRLLLDSGARIEAPFGTRRWTALHLCADRDLAEVCRTILEHPRFAQSRAALDATDDEWKTPLHRAAAPGSRRVWELLLEAGADPVAKDRFGNTPLHSLAFSEDGGSSVAMAERLVPALPSPEWINDRNGNGETPLGLAAPSGRQLRRGNPALQRLLEGLGARH